MKQSSFHPSTATDLRITDERSLSALRLISHFVILEVIYGRLSNSLALVADAGHNLSYVLGLALAWGAMVLARRSPTSVRTYGFRSSSILAALINAAVLLTGVGAIAWGTWGLLRDSVNLVLDKVPEGSI